MTPLAHDLAARGYLAWNVEYRRVGQVGGGWPGTLVDAAAAVDALEGVPDADLERLAAVGHSAGGHLALWLAARSKQAVDAPGGSPRIGVRLAVSLGGVCDLVRGADAELGAGACAALLGGGPADVPERYAMASPAALLPLGTRQVLVHGGRDDVVPPSQSRDYAAAARAAGDDVELVLIDDADHFDLIEPSNRAWKEVADRLGTM
jgi:acetyl esterase/lipase